MASAGPAADHQTQMCFLIKMLPQFAVHKTMWATVANVFFLLRSSMRFSRFLCFTLPLSVPGNLKSITNEFQLKGSSDLTSFSGKFKRNSLAVDLRAEAM